MEFLYEGKAKRVFKGENENEVVIFYKDDATAFNNLKKGTIENKGIVNSKITEILYGYLEKAGIKTHLLKVIDERTHLCQRVSIIPLEVIVRNIMAGSGSKRLGMEEGSSLNSPIIEICYKKDELNDPLINDYHAISLGLATREDLDEIYRETLKINELLQEFFKKCNLTLVDFKIEFGKNSKGEIILADEISPDTCRLWDMSTGQKMDKDRFRRDLGNVEEAYLAVLQRVTKEGDQC
ncbi:MAG: phosphoribosylaminoimidazolesuccinocarboxamide synthase [Cetobacterium sp.]|uniref:phosphoribosylaminoimidazolesuccinocarboxamide synthase n=1 Tax=Cetobacterium sp. TaxID=2071632 RepID=UPI003F3E0E36